MRSSAPFEVGEAPSEAGAKPGGETPLYSSRGDRIPFSSCVLDELRTWRTVAASFGAHVLATLALASVPIIVVHEIAIREPHLVVEFVSQPEAEPLPPPPAARIRVPAPMPRRIEKVPLLPSPRELVVQRPPEPPPPEIARPEPDRPEPPVVAKTPLPTPFDPPKPAGPARQPVKREVRTNLLSDGSSAPPTVTLPARGVQTGGFGDPDGKAGKERTRNPAAPTQLGSFDLPPGPGLGNGSGGAGGVRGTVASVGFGNGIATEAGAYPRGAGRGGVKPTTFGGSVPVPEAARPRPKPVESPVVPIEIVLKPRPAYTEEARKLRVEGEVLLEVTFGASGRIRVLRVIRGLGHGLDESAVQAAEQIQFKPARSDNQPVDYTATLRMVFQLAY